MRTPAIEVRRRRKPEAPHAARGEDLDRRPAIHVEPLAGWLAASGPRFAADPQRASWRATGALRIEALLGPRDEDRDLLALTRLGERLGEWVANGSVSRGLQVVLLSEPAHQAVETWLVIEHDESDADSAVRSTAAGLRDVLHLADGCDVLRLGPVADAGELVARVLGREWKMALVAEPVTWEARVGQGQVLAGLPRRPGGAVALAEVVRLLACQASPVAASVALRRSVDLPWLSSALSPLSAAVAAMRGDLAGVRFAADGGRTGVVCYPEDIVGREGLLADAEQAAAWLARLRTRAIACRVAVVASEDPGEPLLHAVGRAWLGNSRATWMPCTSDQASLVARGPLSALGCPLGGGRADEAAVPALVDLPREVVPMDVAGVLLQPPLPGATGLPGVRCEAARARPVPGHILRPGPGFALGDAQGPTGPVRVRIPPDDLARHLYVVGRTGVGKSTLLRTLVLDLLASGEGVGLIDPHGDLADEILEAAGGRRVVVFDPTRPTCAGLDPLHHDGSEEGQERAVDGITAILFRLFRSEMMGPMFDRHSRALLVPLVAARRSVADVSRIEHDEEFRDECLDALDSGNPIHQEIRRFWEDEYPGWTREHRAEMRTYTVSKFALLARSRALRRVYEPARQQLDIRRVAERGDVLVARLPQGVIGEVSAWFLGMLLLARIQEQMFARVALRSKERRPFTLVIDEFQNFLGSRGFGYAQDERTLGPLLSESRKFGLRLVLSNQYVAQLDAGTRDALLGNAGSLIAFRLGAGDAELLAAEIGDGVTSAEMRELPMFHAIARILHGGQVTPPFTLKTCDPR